MTALAQLALFKTETQQAASSPQILPPPPAPAPLPPRAARRSQAWLALYFPDLSLAAARGAMPIERQLALAKAPWAVIDTDRMKRVVACNSVAWERGVRPGHTMNAAIALTADLELVLRDAIGEAELLRQIATDCFAYTSSVSMQPPNELLLEVRGSFRLFGGVSALMEQVKSALTSLGIEARMALAPTARSALWLARAASTPCVCLPRELMQRMASLPISILHWPPSIELQLLRFGVVSLGDLLRLPRKDLGRRIGWPAVQELEQALGRAPWLQPAWQPPTTYTDRILLDFEVETTGLLEKILARALARLRRTLVRGALAMDEMQLTLKHRETLTPVVVRLHEPTSDVEHVASLLHEHLDRLILSAPIREVILAVPRLLVAQTRSQALAIDPSMRVHSAHDPQAASHLLEQLQSRFGAQTVLALGVRGEHLPERAQHLCVPTQYREAAALPLSLPRRPLWLLSVPKPVDAEHRRGAFTIETSPETIEVEAWDGGAIRRAYYRARTREGARWWVFRDLTSPDHWYLHGLFG